VRREERKEGRREGEREGGTPGGYRGGPVAGAIPSPPPLPPSLPPRPASSSLSTPQGHGHHGLLRHLSIRFHRRAPRGGGDALCEPSGGPRPRERRPLEGCLQQEPR
jgi:hypothetical protein